MPKNRVFGRSEGGIAPQALSFMSIVEVILIAVGLAMDAFAVSVCKGLKMRTIDYRYTFIRSVLRRFSGSNAAYRLVCRQAIKFEAHITSIDHWIAFVLLAFIGGEE